MAKLQYTMRMKGVFVVMLAFMVGVLLLIQRFTPMVDVRTNEVSGQRTGVIGQEVSGQRTSVIGQEVSGQRTSVISQEVSGQRTSVIGQEVIGERTSVKGQEISGQRTGVIGREFSGQRTGVIGQEVSGQRVAPSGRSVGSLTEADNLPPPAPHPFRTKPYPFYPLNGTGTSTDVTDQYDHRKFNLLCKVSWDLAAVLPVYSAPENFRRRQAIRETVGSECVHFRCKVFFIIGISTNETLNRLVKEEYHERNDILIIDKIDTYRDLNNKAVAMLDWLIEFCPEAKYVIHMVDDTYPNIANFLNELETIEGDRYILGQMITEWNLTRMTVSIRSPLSKFYVSEDEFPYEFPNFLAGSAYAFLNSDSRLLRNHVHVAPYCWLEDVWFIGLVAKETGGFRLIQAKHFFIRHHTIPISREKMAAITHVHQVAEDEFFIIYSSTARDSFLIPVDINGKS